MNDAFFLRKDPIGVKARPQPGSAASGDAALPLYFGAWLGELVERLEGQEREISELKKRLEQLEPVEAPLTPAQFCARHGFKPGTIRDWLFHRSHNGLEDSGAVITKGRRIFVYEAAILRWLRDTKPPDRRFPRS